MSFTYKYPRPAVTTDIIIIKKHNGSKHIMLIKRLNSPFENSWALPGGFVDKNEALQIAAKRELKEETSISNAKLKQFKTYGDPGRDPRGHTISVVYYGQINDPLFTPKAGDDAKEVKWFNVNSLPELAFDHAKIIQDFLHKKTTP